MPEVESRENGTASETPADPTGNGGSSNLKRGVATALVATAVGTAVAAAAKARSGSSGAEEARGEGGENAGAGVKERFERASKRGEPFLAAVWDTARDSLEPLTKTGARQAGRFVAERSPEFVRKTIIPPFVEGLTEGRADS